MNQLSNSLVPQTVVKMGHFVAIILLSAVSVILAQRELCQEFLQECQSDDFKVGSKRMILFSREKSWAEAKDHCEKMGRRLLTTTTRKDVDDLKDYLKARVAGNRRYTFTYWNLWLAATDLEPEGVWTWQTSKQDLNSTYTTWAKGEPSGGDEHCLELSRINFDNTWWNDVDCEAKKRYICEMYDGGRVRLKLN